MKSMWPPLAAIFFMTCLYRPGKDMAPSAPPGSATATEGGILLESILVQLNFTDSSVHSSDHYSGAHKFLL